MKLKLLCVKKFKSEGCSCEMCSAPRDSFSGGDSEGTVKRTEDNFPASH